MTNKCEKGFGCFEEEVHHKILDIGLEYYRMQQDPSKKEFLNKLRSDTSHQTQRIVQIMALCFDEYDLYMSKNELPRDYFENK